MPPWNVNGTCPKFLYFNKRSVLNRHMVNYQDDKPDATDVKEDDIARELNSLPDLQ
jgi:hypothetical protein